MHKRLCISKSSKFKLIFSIHAGTASSNLKRHNLPNKPNCQAWDASSRMLVSVPDWQNIIDWRCCSWLPPRGVGKPPLLSALNTEKWMSSLSTSFMILENSIKLPRVENNQWECKASMPINYNSSPWNYKPTCSLSCGIHTLSVTHRYLIGLRPKTTQQERNHTW